MERLQAGNPAPVVDYFDPDYPQGRIFLFYNTGEMFLNNDMRLGKGTREVHYITSEDQGKTWSANLLNITEEVHFNATTTTQGHLDWRTHASTPGHALQFKRGTYTRDEFISLPIIPQGNRKMDLTNIALMDFIPMIMEKPGL